MSIVSQEFLDINGLSHYNGLIKEQIPSLIVLTQAEYDALTETQKNDPNKYYYISDSSAVNANILNDLSDVNITNPAEDEILAYDNINHRWINKVNRGGVTSFNGRSGSIVPTAGDYSAEDITYGQSTVKDVLDNIGNSVVSSFNGRNGSVLPIAGDYTADKIIFSSIMHIGGETQSNVEDGVTALNDTKVECVTIATEEAWNQMTEAEKNDPSKLYFLPWDTSGSGGGSSTPTADQVMLSSVMHIAGGTQKTVQDVADCLNIIFPYIKIVTWADGTDEEIAEMLNLHYQGIINLYNYWSVGDERTVSLSAMSATGVIDSHVAQDITMVLMNEGGKTLVTPINGHTECAFIVGQKNILANGTTIEGGYMNSTDTNSGGWDQCARRTWCNSIYKNALPSTLVGIFKEHQNITSQGSTNHSVTTISNDYFALPSEKEVLGATTYANSTTEANNTQFKYYETSNNRIKYYNDNKTSTVWFTRSPCNNNAYFSYIDSNGSVSYTNASQRLGIAPFGVI